MHCYSKPRLGLLSILAILLVACAPSVAAPRSTEAAWNTITPQVETYTSTVPAPRETAEQVQTCAPVNGGDSTSLIQLTVESSGQETLTYCIRLIPSKEAEKFVAPDLLIHLPASMQTAQTAGAGWICERESSAQDDILPDLHIDHYCRNASVQAHYSGLVRVTISAGAVRADDRICVQAIFKNRVETDCLPAE